MINSSYKFWYKINDDDDDDVFQLHPRRLNNVLDTKREISED